MATHFTILAWKIPRTDGISWTIVHGGCKESDTTEQARMHPLWEHYK